VRGGAKVRRVTRARTKILASEPVEGPKGLVLEGQSTATCSKVKEGSGERPGSRDIDRIFPAQAEPAGCGSMARTMSRRESARIGTENRHFGSPFEPLREERGGAARHLLPLKTRRITYTTVADRRTERKAAIARQGTGVGNGACRTGPSVNL